MFPAVVLVLLALWVSWTANRLSRLGTRVDLARLSLEAQLVRRCAAAHALVDHAPDRLGPDLVERLRAACRASVDTDDAGREAAENDLSRVLADLPDGLDPDLMRDLADASARADLSRRFYNDAVRDTRALRSARLSRLAGLVRRAPAPAFFEIADTTVTTPYARSA